MTLSSEQKQQEIRMESPLSKTLKLTINTEYTLYYVYGSILQKSWQHLESLRTKEWFPEVFSFHVSIK